MKTTRISLLLLLLPLACAGHAWNPFARPAPEGWSAQEWCARAKELGLERALPAFRTPLLPPGGKAAGKDALDATLRLFLAPDEAFLAVRETPGVRTDLRLLAKGPSAALVARSEEGLRFTPLFSAESSGGELARRLKIPCAKRALTPRMVLSPADLLALRALYSARLADERLLPEVDPADLPGHSLTDLSDLLRSADLSVRILAQPPRVRAALAALTAERFGLGKRLESLRERGLARRRILEGSARYALSPAGLRAVECLFAPRDRLLLSRLPADGDERLPLEAVGWAGTGGFALAFCLLPDGSIEILPLDPADPVAALAALLALLRELSFAGSAG